MLLACLEVSPQEGSVLSGLPTMLSALVHAVQSQVKSEAVFAVWTWQANDKVSCRGAREDVGRMMGGGCCCPASSHSSDFFVPALGGQIPQAISNSACGRIKAASIPGFVSDVWLLWHGYKVRIFCQLKAVCVRMCVCLWLLSCLILAGGLYPSYCLGLSHLPGCMFL